MDRKNELLIRVYLVFGMFVLFALVIIGRVAKISLVEGQKWRDKGGTSMKWQELEPERGDIYDVNGNLLATSLPYFEIRMDLLSPKQDDFDNAIDSLAICLAKYPGKQTAADWRKELRDTRKLGQQGKKRGTRYHFVAKDIPLEGIEVLESYPLFRLGRHKGGFIKIRDNRRFHPYKSLASRTIGIDRENASNVGLEASYDPILKGDVKKMLMEKIGPGLWVPVADPTEIHAQKGKDLVSTLNVHMQDVVHHGLEKALIDNKARAGCAILMEVKTGAIRAMANLDVGTDSSYVEKLNHAITTRTEPGSTFKLASSLVYLNKGLVDEETRVDLHGGKKRFYDITMYDSRMHGKREVPFSEVFFNSSNVGMAIVAQENFGRKSEWESFYNAFDEIGMIAKTEVDLLGEPDPIVKHPLKNRNEWYGTTVPWMAHGYELMTTPLQMLNLYNAVANDGRLMKPYLIEKILSEGNVDKVFRPRALHESIAEPVNIQKMQDLLRAVVKEGTGRTLQSNIVDIAGKTGTTRVNYSRPDMPKEYNASFAGYFPAENPKYSLIVCVYAPQNGKYYGGAVAGPVFKEIAEHIIGIDEELMKNENHLAAAETIASSYAGYSNDYEEVFAYIGVKPVKKTQSNWVSVSPNEQGILVDKKKIYKKRVPNVNGMGLRDATYVLESLGLTVKSFGAGKVYKQSVAPGTDIEGNDIEIYLN